ncbi:tail fiber domain-containing protein, partial [Bacteroidales bacterium AH-315-I05]|nr:tail fiber domain-containing protein [Bacteroidales bacterium AH-315-I05]
GVPNWVHLFYGSSDGGWDLTGNAGTTVGTNFLGTTDLQDLAIYTNNTERFRVTSAGNVGIGTASPTASGGGKVVHIQNSTRPELKLEGTAPNSLATIVLKNDADEWHINMEGILGDGLGFWNGGHRLFIQPSGNVGIGTITPTSKLHLYSSIDGEVPFYVQKESVAGIASLPTGIGGNTTAVFARDGNSDIHITHGSLGTASSIFFNKGAAAYNTEGSITYQSDTDFMNFVTGGTEQVRIDAAGNVGIGTTTPFAKLHVFGNASLKHTTTTTSNAIAMLIWGDDRHTSGTKSFVWGLYSLGLNGESATTTDAIGVYGIGGLENSATGTVTNGYGLRGKVQDGAGTVTNGYGVYIENTEATTGYGLYQVGADDDNYFAGNVGIGTTTPGSKLEVAGQVKITGGTPGLNKVLTSDAAGLATWETPSGGAADYSDGGEVGGADRTLGNTDNFDLGFLTNGLNRLHIQNDGYVGIGTTAPLDNLDVVFHTSAGNRRFRTRGGRGVALQREGDTGAWAMDYGFVSNDGLIDWGGFGGFGSGNSTFSYYFVGKSYTDATLTITEGSLANGNVGIGTTAPGAKLEVAGQIKITGGTPDAGRVLTSDAAGLATWQIPSSGSGDFSNGGEVGAADRTLGNTDNVDLGFLTNNINRLHIQNDGNVGIGTTGPVDKLQVEQNVNGKLSLSVVNANTGTGAYAQLTVGKDAVSDVGGLQYLGTGFSASGFNNPDQVNLYASLGATNGLGLNAQAAGAPIRFATQDSEKMRITSTGNVGIGTATPGGQFELSLDQGRKPATNTWTIVSDERLKNIEGAYTKGLNEILQLKPITYHYKNLPPSRVEGSEAKGLSQRIFSEEVLNTQNVGFSAQEVQKIFPEAVGTDADGYLNFNMHAILVAYVNAIKELKAENEALKDEVAEISALKNKVAEIDALKAELEAVKEIIGMEVKK